MQPITDMNSYVTYLPSLGILEIHGDDAETFLQGQLTSDIAKLAEGQSGWSAWCNAQGRVISSFIISVTAGHYYLILPADMVDSVCRRLRMFVLRARLQIQDITATHGCLGVHLDPSGPDAGALLNWDFSIVPVPVPGEPARTIWITARSEMPALYAGLGAHGVHMTDDHHWRLRDIGSALPWVHTQTSELALPQELNLESLEGLSYNKGCYPGQEVIARMHFRGRQKRELARGQLDPATPLPGPGTRLPGASDAQSSGFILYGESRADGSVELLLVVENALVPGTVRLDGGEQLHLVPLQAAPAR